MTDTPTAPLIDVVPALRFNALLDMQKCPLGPDHVEDGERVAYCGICGWAPAILTLCDLLDQRTRERDELRTRAVIAEQHKTLSVLGKSSYQEVVEDQLRTRLAEVEIERDALHVRVRDLEGQLATKDAALNALGRTTRHDPWPPLSQCSETGHVWSKNFREPVRRGEFCDCGQQTWPETVVQHALNAPTTHTGDPA